MRFRVHVYAVVRVPIDVDQPDVTDAAQAARRADASVDLHELAWPPWCEYAEEIDSFLVDELNPETGGFVAGKSVLLDSQFEPMGATNA